MTHDQGLTTNQAVKLAQTHGPNALPEAKTISNWSLLIAQIKNPLVYVLLLACGVTLLLRHYPDALIIFLAVMLNTVLGFFQEKKANSAFHALQKFVSQKTEVIRDGQRVTIDGTELVPGDVVVLAQGAKVPADGVLIFANRVFFDEAIITGEGAPVEKDTPDEIWMGTTLASGQARMRVVSTGSKTKIGSIATEIQSIDEDTPLKKQLTIFSKKLVVIILILVASVFLIGIVRGNSWEEMFATSVALAVSSIPEGLIVSLTVILAIGMQKILKRRGLVRKLSSAETLGGVTTICVDKTGTLTEGKMQVVDVVGNQAIIAQQMILANDLDDPLVIAAYNWAVQHTKTKPEDFERLDSIPFSAKDRFFVSLHHWDKNHNQMLVNGAPDALLAWTTLSKSEQAAVLTTIDTLTSEGRRLIGIARKTVPASTKSLESHDVKKQLEWVGLIAFFDPVRPSVKTSLEKAQQAGINIMVITGDYAKTAEFVLSEIGQPVTQNDILLGEDIAHLSSAELSEKVQSIKLFARTTPDQKLTIVEALQRNGEVVAMMGDGVNDAPAIHRADIGIAVSEASDVCRESADLVLLDSDFSTILAAVEEGRGIFDNIRKVTLYLLSDAFSEILVVIGGMLLGLPLPITAIQIIWINLVSDGFPGLALIIDPKRPGIMNEKPRLRSEQLVNHWMIALIATVSVFAGGTALITFIVTYNLTQSVEIARSMTFLTLGLNSLTYVFSVRSLLVPIWKTHIFANKWLLLTVAAGFLLQILPFATEPTRNFFKVVALDLEYWLIAICLSLGVFLAVEVFKGLWGYRLVLKNNKPSHS